MITIKMIQHEDKPPMYCPMFLCDVCGKQITDAQMALYKWEDDEERNPKAGTFIMAHKGICDQTHNLRHDAQAWPWDEFTTLLGLLINNSQQEEDKVKLWPYLIENFCPDDQLEQVSKIAKRIFEHPEDRPPSLKDFAY